MIERLLDKGMENKMSSYSRWCTKYSFLVVIQSVVILCKAKTCADEYVEREDSKCCKIVYCQPGQEIIQCNNSFEPEICSNCTAGKVQPLYISSRYENRSCYIPENTECYKGNIHIPSRVPRVGCFPRYCACNTYSCYWDDHCNCVSKLGGCPENYTLEVNGDCSKCPEKLYRLGVGCGPCVKTPENSFRKETTSHIFTSETSKITTDSNETILYTGIGAIIVSLLVVIAILVFWFRRRRAIGQINSFSQKPEENDSSPLERINGTNNNTETSLIDIDSVDDCETKVLQPIERLFDSNNMTSLLTASSYQRKLVVTMPPTATVQPLISIPSRNNNLSMPMTSNIGGYLPAVAVEHDDTDIHETEPKALQ